MKSIFLNLMMFITFYYDNNNNKTHIKKSLYIKIPPSKYFCIEKKSVKFDYGFYSFVESEFLMPFVVLVKESFDASNQFI